jgi:MoaA/NifB/PqqE/SkfB family radical SAM enzyme
MSGEAQKYALRSLSLFVGTGECNGNCRHCAGKIHRKYAPEEDGIINSVLIGKTLRECYAQGARYLSISSSGEPTLSPISVTKTLEIVNGLITDKITYSPINLYSNGIRIGEDEIFCAEYLSKWKKLGLKWIYLTVHDTDELRNAQVYRVKKYPKLETIVGRIHQNDLLVRANIVLSKDNIATLERFIFMAEDLKRWGFDSMSAWPIRGDDDKINIRLAPSQVELEKIERWVVDQGERFGIRLLTEKNRDAYEKGEKLTLFPDGTLSNSWCN